MTSKTYTVEDLLSNLPDEWKIFVNINKLPVDWDRIIDILNTGKFYPRFNDIFNAFSKVSPSNVKVVIIGQDPYINPGQAHGLSFSVNKGIPPPPSLRNIFNELIREYNIDKSNLQITDGCLTKWTTEGVLLLNTILTVKPRESNSHKGIGWEDFTNAVIRKIDEKYKHIVFLAWGNQAAKVCENIKNNTVIYSGHPSPMNTSNPFVGSNCFMQCNKILMKNGLTPINWLKIWEK